MSYASDKAPFLIIAGAALLYFAPSSRKELEETRDARLKEFDEGRAEHYFEQRRQVEAYSITSPIKLRILGCLMVVIIGLVSLFLPSAVP